MNGDGQMFVIDSVYTLSETEAKVLFPDEKFETKQLKTPTGKSPNLPNEGNVTPHQNGGEYWSNSQSSDFTLNTQRPPDTSHDGKHTLNDRHRLPTPVTIQNTVTTLTNTSTQVVVVPQIEEFKTDTNFNESSSQMPLSETPTMKSASPTSTSTPFSKKHMILSRHYKGSSVPWSTPTSPNISAGSASPLIVQPSSTTIVADTSTCEQSENNWRGSITQTSTSNDQPVMDAILHSRHVLANLNESTVKSGIMDCKITDPVGKTEIGIQSAAAKLREMAEKRASELSCENLHSVTNPRFSPFTTWGTGLSDIARTGSSSSIENLPSLLPSPRCENHTPFRNVWDSQNNIMAAGFDRNKIEMIPKAFPGPIDDYSVTKNIIHSQHRRLWMDSTTNQKTENLETGHFTNKPIVSMIKQTCDRYSPKLADELQQFSLTTSSPDIGYQNRIVPLKTPRQHEAEATQAAEKRQKDGQMLEQDENHITHKDDGFQIHRDAIEKHTDNNMKADSNNGNNMTRRVVRKRTRRRRRKWCRKKQHHKYTNPKARRQQESPDSTQPTAALSLSQNNEVVQLQLSALLKTNGNQEKHQQLTPSTREQQQHFQTQKKLQNHQQQIEHQERLPWATFQQQRHMPKQKQVQQSHLQEIATLQQQQHIQQYPNFQQRSEHQQHQLVPVSTPQQQQRQQQPQNQYTGGVSRQSQLPALLLSSPILPPAHTPRPLQQQTEEKDQQNPLFSTVLPTTIGEIVDSMTNQYMLPDKATAKDDVTGQPPLKERVTSSKNTAVVKKTLQRPIDTSVTSKPKNREDMTLIELLRLPTREMNFEIPRQTNPVTELNQQTSNLTHSSILKQPAQSHSTGTIRPAHGIEPTLTHPICRTRSTHGIQPTQAHQTSTADPTPRIERTQTQSVSTADVTHMIQTISTTTANPSSGIQPLSTHSAKTTNPSNGIKSASSQPPSKNGRKRSIQPDLVPKKRDSSSLSTNGSDDDDDDDDAVYDLQAQRIKRMKDILKEREIALEIVKRLKCGSSE